MTKNKNKNKNKNTKETRFFWSFSPSAIVHNFSRPEESEWQQGIIRIVILIVVSCHFASSRMLSSTCSTETSLIASLLVAYLFVSILIMLSLRWFPGQSALRRGRHWSQI
jgi:hypothetical protein